MNVLELIAPEAPTGGLAISDTHVHIALSHSGRSKKEELIVIEEALPSGVVVDGVVADPDALVTTLKHALLKTRGTSYYIVSIPPHRVFAKVFTFPLSVALDRLPEAVELALGFQLPFPIAEANVDWHQLPQTEVNRVYVVATPKSVIASYERVLAQAGVRAVAIEPHTMSAARSHTGAPVLTLMPYATSVVATIFEEGFASFARTLPLSRFVSTETQEREIGHIQDFYAIETGTRPVLSPWSEVSLPQTLAPMLSPTVDRSASAIPLGALVRARMHRSDDNLVSLLPVGTEEAYAFQKAIAFSGFLRDVTIGIALFFMVAYGALFFIVLHLRDQTAQTLSVRTISPASAQIVEQEVEAHTLNDLLATSATVMSESPHWSTFIEELRASVPQSITLTNIIIESPDQPIRLSGIATTRAALTEFRQILSDRGDLTEIELPLTHLEVRSAIPFSLTFKLADPSRLTTY